MTLKTSNKTVSDIKENFKDCQKQTKGVSVLFKIFIKCPFKYLNDRFLYAFLYQGNSKRIVPIRNNSGLMYPQI